MAIIYCIFNDINDKVYIGKTEKSLNKRWHEHIRDSKNAKRGNRPLYKAMFKYGVEHFSIKCIETCDAKIAALRESHWINEYDSFYNGYNATLGGDGKSYIDYERILQMYDDTLFSSTQIAAVCECSVDTVRYVVKQYRPEKNWNNRYKRANGKNILCVEENISFLSIHEAASWIAHNKNVSKNCTSHLRDVLNGKRKTCGGYRWKYIQ